jgi:phage/plasmid-associated DNA primase
MFGQSMVRAKIAANGFTDVDIHERIKLPGYRKLQYLKICLESSQIKTRLGELLALNPNYEIFPTHLLSSFTREEKRNYHLIMESKRTKASAQVIDASKISKEPPREYIQTTNGIVKLPNFEEFTRITERLFEEHFTTHLNGVSNEQQ